MAQILASAVMRVNMNGADCYRFHLQRPSAYAIFPTV